MDTAYITGKALINVVDLLITNTYRGQEATLPAPIEDDHTVIFSLAATEKTDLRIGKRSFTWFIRQNADTIAERLETTRNLSRADGREHSVSLTGLELDERWPKLSLTVLAAGAQAA